MTGARLCGSRWNWGPIPAGVCAHEIKHPPLELVAVLQHAGRAGDVQSVDKFTIVCGCADGQTTVTSVARGERVRAELGYRPHPALVRLMPIADALAHALGPRYEIALHDLRHPERSLCHLAGSVTGRSVGAPATSAVLEALEAAGDDVEDVYRYRTVAAGKVIRSSTIFIRDGHRVIGALGVNTDLTALGRLRDEIDRLMEGPEAGPREEVFGNSVGDLVDTLLGQALAGAVVLGMSPDERLRVVAALQERGVFHAKGSVERVAEELGVSRFTVYGYLRRLRRARRPRPGGGPPPGDAAGLREPVPAEHG